MPLVIYYVLYVNCYLLLTTCHLSLVAIIIANSMDFFYQEEIPVMEHEVSRLQRKFQTLKLLNPSLCATSTIGEALTQLVNDLQLMQGRLEVIPEEGELDTPRSELYRWQEDMSGSRDMMRQVLAQW